MEIIKSAVIYARVSSAEQVSGYSIDAQIEQARAWANSHGYNVVDVYIEPGKSAKTDKRPVFQRMIKDIEIRPTDAIIVHKVDRFARNLLDLLQYKKRLTDNHTTILSVVEEFLNDESPQAEMILKIIGAVGEFVAYNIGTEAQKGTAAKAGMGHYPGASIPPGYIRQGEKKAGRIEPDPELADVILESFTEFATGKYTLQAWTREARRRGYKNAGGSPISRSAWGRIFRSKFYLGKFIWRGAEYEGIHQPLIEQNTWDDVQAILNGRSGGKELQHFWLLKDLLWSDVHERAMTGSRTAGKYPYYRANRGGQEHSFRAELIERRVEKILENITVAGSYINCPDAWLLALQVAPNLAALYHLLDGPQRQKLLHIAIPRHAIHISADGMPRLNALRPGFKFI